VVLEALLALLSYKPQQQLAHQQLQILHLQVVAECTQVLLVE
jgi:hypothetical protein